MLELHLVVGGDERQADRRDLQVGILRDSGERSRESGLLNLERLLLLRLLLLLLLLLLLAIAAVKSSLLGVLETLKPVPRLLGLELLLLVLLLKTGLLRLELTLDARLLALEKAGLLRRELLVLGRVLRVKTRQLRLERVTLPILLLVGIPLRVIALLVRVVHLGGGGCNLELVDLGDRRWRLGGRYGCAAGHSSGLSGAALWGYLDAKKKKGGECGV